MVNFKLGNYYLIINLSLLTMNSIALWNHEPQASGSAVNSDNVMTKFIINKRTNAQKTDVILLNS